MKRCFLVLSMAMLLSMSLPLVARADVVWTPPDDFFEKNYTLCKARDRNFYVNGEPGYIYVYKEPGSTIIVDTITNGPIYHVSFTYNDKYNDEGTQWGVIMLDDWSVPHEQRRSGWVLMEQLTLVYDNISFQEEYRHEFYSYTGSNDALFEVDELVLWTWPGSGIIASTFDIAGKSSDDLELAHTWLVASQAYKDGEGREWGMIPYFYASRDMWVCFSDPGNSEIPAFNPVPEPELWSTAVPSEIPSPDEGFSTTLLVIILVAALAVCTAVLIRVFWKANRPRA